MSKTRRAYLKRGLLSLGAVAGLSQVAKASERCDFLTPEQSEGPFYPISDQLDKDNDLTRLMPGKTVAKGEIILIKGKVIDEDCRPVEKALVEIWQACHTGKYNHPADPNTAELDPHFQYWGRAITNKKGEYIFKTIYPGAYPAGANWVRPPHIHFKVHRRGFEELTSQFYFKGHPLNRTDRVLQSLSASEQKQVMVDLNKDEGSLFRSGSFDITIRSF